MGFGAAHTFIYQLGATIFSLFSAQPLTITGVTGPITVLNYTIFTVIPKPSEGGPLYLGFIAWVYIWSAIMHFGIAILNGKRQNTADASRDILIVHSCICEQGAMLSFISPSFLATLLVSTSVGSTCNTAYRLCLGNPRQIPSMPHYSPSSSR